MAGSSPAMTGVVGARGLKLAAEGAVLQRGEQGVELFSNFIVRRSAQGAGPRRMQAPAPGASPFEARFARTSG
jgi:hypothetical protein